MKNGKLRGISCFAGIGGLDLSIRDDVRTVCYIENEPYCQQVIQKNIKEGILDDAPIWDDIRTFQGKKWAGRVDILFGGFPCTDISVAGNRAGITEDTRSGLWFEFMRVISEVRPPFVFLENVSAITSWFDIKTRPTLPPAGVGLERLILRMDIEQKQAITQVISDLSKNGYGSEWTAVKASDIGAPHRRERWFCLAYDRHGFTNACRNNGKRRDRVEPSCCKNTEYSSINLENYEQQIHGLPSFSWCKDVRRVEDLFIRPNIPKPLICRGDDGFSSRIHRLKCLGNAVVPQQGRLAWNILTNKKAT